LEFGLNRVINESYKSGSTAYFFYACKYITICFRAKDWYHWLMELIKKTGR